MQAMIKHPDCHMQCGTGCAFVREGLCDFPYCQCGHELEYSAAAGPIPEYYFCPDCRKSYNIEGKEIGGQN